MGLNIIFWLISAHFIADYPLQTSVYQKRRKIKKIEENLIKVNGVQLE